MLTLTECLPSSSKASVSLNLSLTAQERTRSRYRLQTEEGEAIAIKLPRGTVLHSGDLLMAEEDHSLVRVVAKPEPVLTVTAQDPLDLLRAAYHLGNRHVPLEITPTYLRLGCDPVLRAMLEQLGLQVTESVEPFQPETGAYNHNH